jgi:PTH1 family peptidyl-tRNA hydrolase
MKCLVGLGNPGPQYVLNRHNIGFMVIDAINQELGDGQYRVEQRALVAKVQIHGQKVVLAKPQTYMNLSGESVAPLLRFYETSLDDLLVIQDDIDQPFGALRFHKKRGSGGHNGIKSLTQHLGTDDYARLKMGVGRPTHPGQDVADYVLQNFSKVEMPEIPSFVETALDAVEMFIKDGFQAASNHFNTKRGP